MPKDITERKAFIDRIAESSKPVLDESHVSSRSSLWWFFIMPGKVILWIQYMFPERFAGVFGSARRRNVPMLQATYSVCFYAVIGFLLLGLIAGGSK